MGELPIVCVCVCVFFGVARWPTLQSAAASGARVGGLAYVCMFICDVTFWPVVLLPTGIHVCECACVCVCVRLCLVRACMAHMHYECALCIYVCSRMYVNMRTCVYVYVTCNDTNKYWV